MRIADDRRRMALLALPVAAALGALLVLPPLASTDVAPQPAAAQSVTPNVPTPPHSDPESLCGVRTRPHHYTFDAGKESEHAFGPPVKTSVKLELTRRLCGYLDHNRQEVVGGDEALLRALTAMADGTDANRTLTPEQAAAEARDFTSRLVWEDSRLVIQAPRPNRPVWTLFMIDGPGNVPRIRDKWLPDTPESDYLEIPVRRHDGTIVVLRLRENCGFQPVYSSAKDTPKGLTQ